LGLLVGLVLLLCHELPLCCHLLLNLLVASPRGDCSRRAALCCCCWLLELTSGPWSNMQLLSACMALLEALSELLESSPVCAEGDARGRS
jgi:hypothetical protein